MGWHLEAGGRDLSKGMVSLAGTRVEAGRIGAVGAGAHLKGRSRQSARTWGYFGIAEW